MRVIAGIAHGRTLAGPPAGAATRPTSDKVREALFDILGPTVAGSRVADLFAGTGALGIEALSRGARHAVFVESDRRLCEVIRRNLAAVGLADRAKVLQRDVRRAASQLAVDAPFDLAFVDPPYQHGLELDALEVLVRHALLAPDALVAVEHASREPLVLTESLGATLTPERSRFYGDTALTCCRATGASSTEPTPDQDNTPP